MPTYVYECPQCGEFEEHQGVNDAPLSTHHCGQPVKRIVTRCSIMAYTPVGEAADRIDARVYRTNKEVVNGLVNGTMSPPDDRDVCGDKQSRSSVAQFNSMLDHARKMK
jgi:putative FmdB family regulatory protein